MGMTLMASSPLDLLDNPCMKFEQDVDLGLRWRHSFAELGPDFFTPLSAQPLPSPYWVGRSERVARQLGLSPQLMQTEESSRLLRVLEQRYKML
jgi:uncharacterized protein YdiU (UPF0061 family)